MFRMTSLPWLLSWMRIALLKLKLLLQGSVFRPIKCCVQIDTLGRDCLAEDKCLYNYKNIISVPPLALIDDIISVTKCNVDAIESNTVVNMKIESKKLRLSKEKCVQIHVSKDNHKVCDSTLKVHDDKMKKAKEGSYLGDILTDDGTLDKTIESRRQKGIGICSQVTGIMNSVSLGFFFFKISFTLRDSMLLNGILTNAEVWNHLKEKHLEILEVVDLMLLKKVLNAHTMTAKEAFFLETGLLPIKFILSKRRLLYLWTILQRDETDLLKRFYQAQALCKTKNDWAELIEKEKKEYAIELTDDEISGLKKNKFKVIVEKAVNRKALEYLNKAAEKHSKSFKLVKCKLAREPYFDDPRLSRNDVELLFSLRTRMVDLKKNFSNKYGGDLSCKVCKVEIESQEHLLVCVGLKSKQDIPKHVAYEDK